VTSVNGQVKTITARIVHIYPYPYVEEEMIVFGDGPSGMPSSSGTDRTVTGVLSPSTPRSSGSSCDLFCSLSEFFQQSWTDFWHFF
jgi:hypothetical protein